jgi:hypothetical protein
MIEHKAGDGYHITGVDCKGRRFKKVTSHIHYALAHNVWRGTLWQVRGGKRTKIHGWYN